MRSTRFQHIKHVCELLLRPCVKGIEEVDEVVLVIQQPSLLSHGAKVAISFYIWKLCKKKKSLNHSDFNDSCSFAESTGKCKINGNV